MKRIPQFAMIAGLALALLFGSLQCQAQYIPGSGSGSALSIPQEQLIQPEALNHLFQVKGTDKPLVLQVGSHRISSSRRPISPAPCMPVQLLNPLVCNSCRPWLPRSPRRRLSIGLPRAIRLNGVTSSGIAGKSADGRTPAKSRLSRFVDSPLRFCFWQYAPRRAWHNQLSRQERLFTKRHLSLCALA